MQPMKLYKFAAATVMTMVAAATVVTFSTTDQAGSSPVAAALPRVPASGGAAPTAGINDELPEPTPTTGIEAPRAETAPPSSPAPETSSRSSERDSSESSSKPKSKPSSPAPSPSPSHHNPLGNLLGNLLGG